MPLVNSHRRRALQRTARAAKLAIPHLTLTGSISWIEMTKAQLIESVASATGQAKSEVERTLDAIVDRASNALSAGDKVELRGFGILDAKETKARTGRNPATGETIQIAASQRVTFRPSKELKERLKGKREESAQYTDGAGGGLPVNDGTSGLAAY